MKIKDLYLENFTAFDQAKFEFCDGINVLIGANGTGKTHAMKIMYEIISNALKEKYKEQKKLLRIELEDRILQLFKIQKNNKLLRNNYENYILPFYGEDKEINDTRECYIDFIEANELANYFAQSLKFKNKNVLKKANVKINIHNNKINNNIYFPTTEMLSIYDHFFATYEKREIPYNKTHYDLALALNAAILRKTHEDYKAIEPIIKNIQEIVTGSKDQQEDLVILENDHFYFNLHGKKLDVNVIADGYRKLGTLYYLLRNGSLTTNSILFWDEPEASLNPILIRKTADIIRQLGLAGIQVFVSTHDYLLAHELSLLAEYPTPPAPEKPNIRFFALYKDEPQAPTQIEMADTLTKIKHDDILAEFAAHDDYESNLFYGA
ncbi:MAG: AAA family ATPase [Candidatus Marithrix sp.]